MKHLLLLPGLLALALAASPVAAQTNPPAPLTVAVLDFEARPELGKTYGAELAALLAAQLGLADHLWPVERAELEKLLAEQELGLSGAVSPDTAAKIGQLTGARVLVTGRAFRAGNELVAVAKVIGTETGRVFGEIAKGGRDAAVTALAEDLAKRVTAITAAKAPALVAPPASRPDHLAALRAQLPAGPRPSARVRLTEQHLSRPVPDPAAATELMWLLKELGCELLAEDAAGRPDLEFTGEAFSETAGRRGGLVGVKARVELTVKDAATGRVLAVDRQVGRAVDSAEHIAAKHALAEAATTLAGRVLPKVLR
jgi:hypothetical protein